MTEATQSGPPISTFLWFDDRAEEAVEFYLSVFKSGKCLDTVRGGEGGMWKNGAVVLIEFEMSGHRYTAFNGGPHHPFNDAISLVVMCRDQDEIDYHWSALTADGGQEIQCGWLRDKFGLSWQIVPSNVGQIVRSPAAMKALLTMKKLDIAALEAAAESSRASRNSVNFSASAAAVGASRNVKQREEDEYAGNNRSSWRW